MASGASSNGTDYYLSQRLKAVHDVDKKIIEMLKTIQQCISELSKEKQISKSKMEESSSLFKRLMNSIESELSSQLQYLSHVCVGTAHQGSTFSIREGANLAQENYEIFANIGNEVSDTHFSQQKMESG